jgi:transposase
MFYVGLDVSQRFTAVCVVDGKGKIVAESKVLTLPSDIHGWLQSQLVESMDKIMKVGLETGAMSNSLYKELTQLGLPVICLEAIQAHRFLEAQRNKTDRNDARSLAQLVRMGEEFIKPVIVRSQASQETRAALARRQQLVRQKIAVENMIGGILKAFGLIVQRGMSAKLHSGAA